MGKFIKVLLISTIIAILLVGCSSKDAQPQIESETSLQQQVSNVAPSEDKDNNQDTDNQGEENQDKDNQSGDEASKSSGASNNDGSTTGTKPETANQQAQNTANVKAENTQNDNTKKDTNKTEAAKVEPQRSQADNTQANNTQTNSNSTSNVGSTTQTTQASQTTQNQKTEENKDQKQEVPQPQPGRFKDGVYKGEAMGYDGFMEVRVIVANGRIDKIEVLSHEDTERIASNAFAILTEKMLSSQSVEVDVVSGASYSSEGFIQAVKKALDK